MTGGAASGRKGSTYERELVNRFSDAGWGALRLGASGSGGDADLPDVLAGKRTPVPGRGTFTETWAVELKSGKATTLYVGSEEVEALNAFATTWGAVAFLGARYTTQGTGTETWLVPPYAARGPTDGGLYGLPVDDITERAVGVVRDAGVEQL